MKTFGYAFLGAAMLHAAVFLVAVVASKPPPQPTAPRYGEVSPVYMPLNQSYQERLDIQSGTGRRR